MSNAQNKTTSFINALPIAHLLVLACVAIALLLIIVSLPKNNIQKTEPIIIPDDLLEQTKTITVTTGDSFSLIAHRAGLSSSEIFNIIASSEEAKGLLNLFPGQEVLFHFDKSNQLISLHYQPSITETLIIKNDAGTYTSEFIVKTLDSMLNYVEGTINDSLFLAANQAGLSDNLTMELADILGWDIDFALDIRSGDRFQVMYEEFFLEGKKVKNGNILATRFFNQNKTITAIRYEDSKQNSGYFTPEGFSMRKAFRRNPLDIVRISSHFNLKRKHPVLHKIRAHRGVDYAARTGTPIRATGDGKVTNARTRGGFGNTVIIQHGQKYTTLYAHLSKYGKGIREGKHVKQGQIIGYVGSTGLATGPHLHYEFRVNGVHRNPITVELPHAKPISANERDGFMKHSRALLERFDRFQAPKTFSQ